MYQGSSSAYESGSQAINDLAQSENIYSELFIIAKGSHSFPRLNTEMYMDEVDVFLNELLW